MSEADIAVNSFLQKELTALAPAAGWLSEESWTIRATLGATGFHCLDPIDGTRAFICGHPEWTISVALVEGGRPVIGTVYAPSTEEFFLAVVGRGTTRNGTPVSTTPRSRAGGSRIAGPKLALQGIEAVEPGIVAAARVHSLALRLARVPTAVSMRRLPAATAMTGTLRLPIFGARSWRRADDRGAPARLQRRHDGARRFGRGRKCPPRQARRMLDA